MAVNDKELTDATHPEPSNINRLHFNYFCCFLLDRVAIRDINITS